MKAAHPLRPVLSPLGVTVLLLGLGAAANAESKEARRTLVATSTFDEAPYAFFDASGHASGFEVELLRAVATAAGVDVSFQTADPEQKVAPDVVLGARYSDDDQPGTIRYCEPHTSRDHAVFVREDSLYRHLRDLTGRALAVPGDSHALSWLESHGYGQNIAETETIGEGFQLLASGRAEAVICERYEGLATLKDSAFDPFRLLPDSVAPFESGFALPHADPTLAHDLESGLAVARNTGQFEKLRAKWLTSLDPAPTKVSFGAIYSALLWLVIPGLALIIVGIVNTLGFRKRAALRIAALEEELAESRQAFHDLVHERARQRYVINQLSTVSLVDQLVEASRH